MLELESRGRIAVLLQVLAVGLGFIALTLALWPARDPASPSTDLRLWLSLLVLVLELAVLVIARRGRLGVAAGLQTFGLWAVLSAAWHPVGPALALTAFPAVFIFLVALATLLLERRVALVFVLCCLATVTLGAWGTPAAGAFDRAQALRSAGLFGLAAALTVLLASEMRSQLQRGRLANRRLDLARANLRVEIDQRTAELEQANARLQIEVEERSQALATLRATADRYQQVQRRLDAILAYLPQIVLYETRGDGGSIVGNIEGLLGYPAASFRSDQQFFLHLIHPEDIRRVRRNFDRWTARGRQGVLTQEFRCRRADGSTLWLQDYAVSVTPPEGEPYLAGVLMDITERRHSEEEREHFTRQLRTAAETAERLTGILDPQVLMDQTVALMQERFGLYHVHFYLYEAETGHLVVRAGSGGIGKAMVEGGHCIPLGSPRGIVAHAAREQRYVLVDEVQEDDRFLPNPLLPATRSEVAVPLMGRDGLIGVLDVQDDRPYRFTASELDTFSTLAGQIAVAIENARIFDALKAANLRLREVDRLKSEFLANMSHELRTPLNSIIGYAELLLMGINGDLDAESAKDIQAIYDNGQQLLTLINDVLDLAKIEAGRMQLDREPIDVATLMEDVRVRNAGLLLRKPVDLRVAVEPNLPPLWADPVRMRQILGNLLSNAVKFTQEGSITLRAYRQGDALCLAVEDSGIGIAAEVLGSIFDKFRQVDGSSTRSSDGTGLGLAITRHLVELHGGQVGVHSQVGEGSVFTVRLPLEGALEGAPGAGRGASELAAAGEPAGLAMRPEA